MKDNIALIGFMGSGKTTVGKFLAKTMDMKFVDIDKVIEAHEKKSINDIFHEKGQIYFRDLEREVILQESLKNDCVIATGGGSILGLCLDALASYGNPSLGDAMTIDRIESLRFTEAVKDIKQGDKFQEIALPFVAIRITNQI